MSQGVIAQIMGPDGLIVLVVLVVVLLFGGSKLPQLARGLGSASHEFKSASEEFKKAAEEGRAELASHSTAPRPPGTTSDGVPISEPNSSATH